MFDAVAEVQLQERPPRTRSEGTVAPHVAAATLFAGMVLAVALPTVFRTGDQLSNAAMAGVLVLSLAIALWIGSHGAWRPQPTLFGILLCIATAAGVPGYLFSALPQESTGILFFVVLAARNYLCFAALPRANQIHRRRFEDVVILWLLISSVLVMIGSVKVASSLDISLDSSGRLTGGNWLNANSTGVYTAVGMAAAVMGRFLPLWVRVSTVCLGAYVLLLTQSRGSMLALAAAVFANWAVLNRRRGARTLVLVFAAGLLAYVALPAALERIGRIGQLKALVERTNQVEQDPWSGRRVLVETAVARIKQAPLFGYGYMSDQSRFENGYLSLLLETGTVGFSAAAAVVVVVVARALRLLRRRRNPESTDLARYTLVLLAFLMAHAIGERTHPFQVAFTGSNAWAILAGLVFVHSSRVRANAPRYAEFSAAELPGRELGVR